MTIKAEHAVITDGSRGIGKGIALKLAEHGVKIAVNYVRDEGAAKSTLAQIRERGSDITGQTIAVDGGASLMDSCLPLAIQQPPVSASA